MSKERTDGFVQWLTLISGIKGVNARNLVEAGYDSLESLGRASIQELSRIEGIGLGLATGIKRLMDRMNWGLKKEGNWEEEGQAILVCSFCGGLITRKMENCKVCGTQLTDEKRDNPKPCRSCYEVKASLYICTNCGAIVSENTKECAICGTEFEEDEEWFETKKEVDKSLLYEIRLDNKNSVTRDFLRRWERARKVTPQNDVEEPMRWEVPLKKKSGDTAFLKRKDYLFGLLRMRDQALKSVKGSQLKESVKEEDYNPATLKILVPRIGVPDIDGDEKPEKDKIVIGKTLSRFDELLKTDSTLMQAWQTKGDLLMKLGRYNEAIVCFDKVIKIELVKRNASKLLLIKFLKNLRSWRPLPGD